MKFKTGDNVVVIAGKDKGKESKIVKIFRKENKVILEGVNLKKKHIKAYSENEGGILEIPSAIDASNIAILDSKTKKASRIGYKLDEKGKKIRISKKSGAEIK